MPTELLADTQGATLVLTLKDTATRNALSREVYARGIELMAQAQQDCAIRAVVLRGDGDTFCAGGNLQRILAVREMGLESGATLQRESVDLLSGWVMAMAECPKPVIAAVEGAAAGAGASLALGCDLVVASRDARFVMSYARIGLSPDGGGSWQMARFLPRALALKVLWLGGSMDASELHAHGLVTELCEPGHALTAALALAERLAQMAPNAVASVKQLHREAQEQGLGQHMQSEREHFVANLFHANGGEGALAFVQKRKALFT